MRSRMSASVKWECLRNFSNSTWLWKFCEIVCCSSEEISVGVERAAAFLATASRSAGGLGRVYTIGGGARVPGLNEALSNRLRVPVELASPVQRLKVRDSVFESVAVDEVSPLLMLSVGLALRRAA